MLSSGGCSLHAARAQSIFYFRVPGVGVAGFRGFDVQLPLWGDLARVLRNGNGAGRQGRRANPRVSGSHRLTAHIAASGGIGWDLPEGHVFP